MRHSRLAGFIIDCRTEDLDGAAAFWSAPLPAKEADRYVRLVDPDARLHIEVQKVAHPSRVHLDIESNDLEAEVNRLAGLGACELWRVREWVVMQVPTGQRFCVVRGEAADLAGKANGWDTAFRPSLTRRSAGA